MMVDQLDYVLIVGIGIVLVVVIEVAVLWESVEEI
jgi:hypothetical protein